MNPSGLSIPFVGVLCFAFAHPSAADSSYEQIDLTGLPGLVGTPGGEVFHSAAAMNDDLGDLMKSRFVNDGGAESPNPTPAPLPAPGVMGVLGFGALALRRRRRTN